MTIHYANLEGSGTLTACGKPVVKQRFVDDPFYVTCYRCRKALGLRPLKPYRPVQEHVRRLAEGPYVPTEPFGYGPGAARDLYGD